MVIIKSSTNGQPSIKLWCFFLFLGKGNNFVINYIHDQHQSTHYLLCTQSPSVFICLFFYFFKKMTLINQLCFYAVWLMSNCCSRHFGLNVEVWNESNASCRVKASFLLYFNFIFFFWRTKDKRDNVIENQSTLTIPQMKILFLFALHLSNAKQLFWLINPRVRKRTISSFDHIYSLFLVKVLFFFHVDTLLNYVI